jgi:hypothetical protein
VSRPDQAIARLTADMAQPDHSFRDEPLLARRDSMDLTMLLAVAVALLIGFSCYFLFFGMPDVRQQDRRTRRTSRR